MNMKKDNAPSWLKDVTNTDKELKAEPFKPLREDKTVDFNGYLVIGSSRSNKKTNYVQTLLRIDEENAKDIEKCQGSKNSVINALLAYALADLKEKNKTLIIKD